MMIKKTFTLLKKDIMLLEAYSLLAILILLALPIFLNYSIKGIMDPIYLLFLSLDFCAFLVFLSFHKMHSGFTQPNESLIDVFSIGAMECFNLKYLYTKRVCKSAKVQKRSTVFLDWRELVRVSDKKQTAVFTAMIQDTQHMAKSIHAKEARFVHDNELHP